MTLNLQINLTPQEDNQLKAILKQIAKTNPSSASPFKWPDTLEAYAQAAVLEHVRMFIGQKVFTRGSDIREYRLSLLIGAAFNGFIPDEQTVSALFQCTLTQSRALIRAVMSKYQYDLSKAIRDTLTQVLQSVKMNRNNALVAAINNESIVAELNKVLALVDSAQDQIVRQTGKLATYELKPDAYKQLCNYFGIPASALT